MIDKIVDKSDVLSEEEVFDELDEACIGESTEERESIGEGLVRKTDKEIWNRYIKDLGDRWDFLNIKFVSVHLPHVQDLKEIIKRAKGGKKSRLFHYCCTEWGYNKFYTHTRKLGLFNMYRIAHEIHMLFDDPKLQEYPKSNFEYPMREEFGRQQITIEVSENQYGKIQDIAEYYGISKTKVAFIFHIYAFNVIFEGRYLGERYDKFYTPGGYLSKIRDNINKIGKELREYLSFAEYYMEKDIEVEKFKVEKQFRPNDLLNEKVKLLDRLRTVLKQVDEENEKRAKERAKDTD